MKLKTIAGVTFYPAATEGKTFAQFAKHEAHHGLAEEHLKHAYDILSPKPELAKSKKIVAPKNKKQAEPPVNVDDPKVNDGKMD